MACCYIAASMIAFIINTCDALNVDIHLQYNETLDPSKHKAHPGDDDDAYPIERCEGPTILSLSGMTCAACTGIVERALTALDGVDRVSVSLPFQEARVVHNPDVPENEMIAAVEEVGYEAKAGMRETSQRLETLQQTKDLNSLSKAFSGSSRLSSVLFFLGTGSDLLGWGSRLEAVLTPYGRQASLVGLTLAISYHYGAFIHSSAWSQAKNWQVNMNTLISLSTTLGLLLSIFNIVARGPKEAYTYFQTVAGLILIVTAGRYLDSLSRRRSTNTFIGLYTLLQETASVKITGQKHRLPASMLKATDKLLIEPYTVIPCDSYVTSGSSSVNEAIVTGESVPKEKSIGDFLLAGTRNGPGILEATVNQDQHGSFLSTLIKTAEEASGSKVVLQEGVETITRYFVAGVLVLAFSASAWVFIKMGDDRQLVTRINLASQRMMSILAAACPCALGLATPCAVMAGIDVAWRKGILMTEGAKAMENLKDVTHLILDKTGTLTEGRLQVSAFKVSSGWQNNLQTISTLVCAAEERGASAHPVGAAVFRETLRLAGRRWQKFKDFGEVRKLQEIIGQESSIGVKCEVDLGDQVWRSVCVGSLKMQEQHGVSEVDSLPQETNDLGTVVFVSIDGELTASILLQDTLRPDAKSTVDALKARGLQITMLTGDNPEEAKRVSEQLEIPVMASGASPHKKLEYVRSLQRQGHRVAMVGDGINDGPSLAASDAGIMIAHGNKCLSAGGSVLILASKLQSLVTLFEISERTMTQVKTNVRWALIYNAVAISLAMGIGHPWGLRISPSAAASVMSLSSLAITWQGLRLRQKLLDQSSTDAVI